ncbi:MAG: CDP-diacylglycerol--serine O-phosphatidyltransferase [Sedimentisphaerales bacterium]|nr:CDP-diacylglycerol--serine O-phosphatidyltransferase [Sedimentisphaerales bacterium]
MPRLKSRDDKSRLLRRVRRQRVKYITVLPSLITILNGVFGFIAIVLAGRGGETTLGGLSYYALAGYMVLLAMLADMLDGRLARMSQSTSSFGGQLDSLCDLVSFGVAPAYIMLNVVEGEPALATTMAGNLFHRFVWLAALAYISCGAIRLARFNVENEENEAAHMSFFGLPSPGAAGVIVSLVILHQEGNVPGIDVLVYALPVVTLGVAILMVSRIRYPHVLNLYLRGRKPFSHLIQLLLFLGVVVVLRQAALVLIFGAFAGGSFARWLYDKLRHKGSRFAPANQEQGAPSPVHPGTDR